jgi:hypothetical protein
MICSIEGYPIPSIKLYKQDENISSNFTTFEFQNKINYTFPRISRSDNGTYSCRYETDSKNSEEKLFHVFVLCKFRLIKSLRPCTFFYYLNR